MNIYIASSWKNQHGIEMLTALLRERGHEVVSWIENNYEEGYSFSKSTDFEEWIKTDGAQKAFVFDTEGAHDCDIFIYYGPGGKDAAAECGICYANKITGDGPMMMALFAKGEDFGLMRKMFDFWFDRYTQILEAVDKYTETVNAQNDF